MNSRYLKNILKESVAPLFGRLYEGLGQIIVLHRVIPKSDKERLRNIGIEITEQHLEQLILFFKKNSYDFISIDELPDYLTVKRVKKFVIFTLDDGYLDNLTNAYPIFKKHAIPFTIYIATDFPDRKAVLWWYLLEDLLLKEERIDFRCQDERIHFFIRSYAQKEEVFNHLRHLIKSKYGASQMCFISALFSTYNMPLYEKVEELALDWGQIIQLGNDPLVTIAAHTVSHPSFKAISDVQIIDEVEQSVQLLESRLNTPIEHFAYPYGSAVEVGAREVGITSMTKVKTATTGRLGNIMSEHLKHMHALPRLYVGPETNEKYLVNFINGRIPFVKGSKQRVVTL